MDAALNRHFKSQILLSPGLNGSSVTPKWLPVWLSHWSLRDRRWCGDGAEERTLAGKRGNNCRAP